MFLVCGMLKPEVKNFLQNQGCTCTFNAPHSSHMGGAWERLIGVVRQILDALLVKDGATRLTHEVLTTLMALAIMNSRPLDHLIWCRNTWNTLACHVTNPKGKCYSGSPSFKYDHLCKGQWRQVQRLADSFWKRWRLEYFATLQPRRKWTKENHNLQDGDVVLIKDVQARCNQWPLGLIVEAIPSSDSRIRKVMVKIFSQGTIKDVVLLIPKGKK